MSEVYPMDEKRLENITKERMGYEKETDSCRNCHYITDRGKCGFNPVYPFNIDTHGICDHYQSGREDNEPS